MEEREKKLYEVFESHNSNSNNKLEPEEVVNLVDEIETTIERYSTLGRVGQFMEAFKQPVLNVPTIPSKDIVHLRLGLILEELTELAQACGSEILSEFGTTLKAKAEEIRNIVENKREILVPDLKEVLDAHIDLQYVLDGSAQSFGLRYIYDAAFTEVHNSNMSKLCKNTEEAAATKEKYSAEGINVEIVPHKNYFLIVRTKDNKILKSINYKPADLQPIVNSLLISK